jgi:hypothetical protein
MPNNSPITDPSTRGRIGTADDTQSARQAHRGGAEAQGRPSPCRAAETDRPHVLGRSSRAPQLRCRSDTVMVPLGNRRETTHGHRSGADEGRGRQVHPGHQLRGRTFASWTGSRGPLHEGLASGRLAVGSFIVCPRGWIGHPLLSLRKVAERVGGELRCVSSVRSMEGCTPDMGMN